jgi:hypothetical protein
MYQDVLVVWLFLHQDNNYLYLRRPKQKCQNSHGVFENRDWILPLTQRNLKLQPLGLPGRPQTTNVDLVGFQGHQPANIPHHWQVRATCALASRASTQLCKNWHLNLMGDHLLIYTYPSSVPLFQDAGTAFHAATVTSKFQVTKLWCIHSSVIAMPLLEVAYYNHLMK